MEVSTEKKVNSKKPTLDLQSLLSKSDFQSIKTNGEINYVKLEMDSYDSLEGFNLNVIWAMESILFAFENGFCAHKDDKYPNENVITALRPLVHILKSTALNGEGILLDQLAEIKEKR